MTFWAGYAKRPMGKGNPYYCCVGCGITDPSINGDINRHGPGCPEVQKYLAELNPNDYTPFAIEGTVYRGGDEIEYEIVVDREVYIRLVTRNLYGVFYPLRQSDMVFPNALVATEALRDAVGLLVAKDILIDGDVPRSHVMWKLGSKG